MVAAYAIAAVIVLTYAISLYLRVKRETTE
jgi:hypothetical protein